jgi:hypothetical protein
MTGERSFGAHFGAVSARLPFMPISKGHRMNKAITDGLLLMPPPFANGLNVWSSGDGVPGSATYDGAPNAAFVPADQDFAGCLELVKTQATQKLRYMGETPILPGCYLRVTARMKAVSGNLPSVRIAAWAGGTGGVAVTGLTMTGPSVTLTSYGDVVTVSAIVGTGNRGGVDMPWTTQVLYGHFGLDLTGPNGGVVRIDDIEIEDITSAFLRDMMDWVDVRDFGAVGDGVANDRPAFVAADAAAAGRQILVPAGTYRITSSLTLSNPVRFQGKVDMPENARLVLLQNFNFVDYVDAFGGDEELALRKGLQALFNFSDHDSFDLRGRSIDITRPIDVQAAVNNRTDFSIRRILRNGQLIAVPGPEWDTIEVTSQATYSLSSQLELTGVANVANIPVGSLVVGNGVGREVYVTAKNVAAGRITLSKPLFGAVGTQVYTFRRFKYVLDFSNFAYIDKFGMHEIEIQCSGLCSAILLPPDGLAFSFVDCTFNRPKDRAITSHGAACAGMLIDRCQFMSNEISLPVQSRVSVAVNVNSNDVKIRDCRAIRFRHFAILGGLYNLIANNHIFAGDSEPEGVRVAGIVFTASTSKSTVTGNYIDNCFIELANEHDAEPDFSNEFSFGGLLVTGNVFLAIGVAAWFRWIVIKPYGPGHFIDGLVVQGNTFQSASGRVDRAEGVDTTFASLDMTRTRNFTFANNSFNNVDVRAANPITLPFTQNTAGTVWNCDFAPSLPFGGRLRAVDALVAEGMITTAGGTRITEMPFVTVEQGPNATQARLNWATAARGSVRVTGRMDATM